MYFIELVETNFKYLFSNKSVIINLYNIYVLVMYNFQE